MEGDMTDNDGKFLSRPLLSTGCLSLICGIVCFRVQTAWWGLIIVVRVASVYHAKTLVVAAYLRVVAPSPNTPLPVVGFEGVNRKDSSITGILQLAG